MRKVVGLALWLWLLAAGLTVPLYAASIKVAWDPGEGGGSPATGYKIRYSDTSPSGNPRELDVFNTLAATIPNLDPNLAYFITVVAYDKDGNVSAPSNQVVGTPQADTIDPCSFPLGANSVQIFPTGKLNRTGNGSAGSRAFISFQIASPNSPIVYESIRANGTDIPDSITDAKGAPTGRLSAIGSLWFTIPSGPATYTFSIYAQNLAGCSRDQSTGFSIVIP
jgi:hypothetical protein